MTFLFDLLYAGLVGLAWPLLIVRRVKRGPGSIALGERLARDLPSRPVAAHCVWLHGVSLGEVNALRTLVAELRRRSPSLFIAISSTTQTGLARARTLYGRDHLVFRFPLDFSSAVRRVFDRVRPSAIVLLELEVWPNLLEIARQRGVPVVIANGRVTAEKSVRRFNWPGVRWLARRMFGQLAWIGAQDETYAERFRRLGVPAERVSVTGSLKYDAAEIADEIAGQDALADALGIDRRAPLWVCGSTGPGEERAILAAYAELRHEFPTLQLAIVPRKPERFDEVATLCANAGSCLRRSEQPDGAIPPSADSTSARVIVGDTLGELRKFYALATVVFVGRSLAPMGGSDMMEVAGLAKPMIVGPHTENFAEVTRLLAEANAVTIIPGEAALTGAVAGLLRDGAAAQRMGLAAREAIVAQRGATDRTVERILTLVFE